MLSIFACATVVIAIAVGIAISTYVSYMLEYAEYLQKRILQPKI